MPIRRAEMGDRELPYLWDFRHVQDAAYVKRDYQDHNLVHTQALHVYSGETPGSWDKSTGGSADRRVMTCSSTCLRLAPLFLQVSHSPAGGPGGGTYSVCPVNFLIVLARCLIEDGSSNTVGCAIRESI